jgi:tRNA(fMet)-specific endonuclease VapC
MALRIAIDANRYSDVCGGLPAATAPVQRAELIVMPFVVLGELRAGFRGGRQREHNERILNRFLHSPRVEILFADEATTDLYADLVLMLRSAGKPIPTNDVWIASLCIQHDLTLLTRDQHFEAIPHLPRI